MAKTEEEDESHKNKEETSAKPKPQSSTAQISNNKRPKSTTGKNTLESKQVLKQQKTESQSGEQDHQSESQEPPTSDVLL